MNKVAAIIITFNPDIDLLKKQQESILSQVDTIIYVDNGSSNLKEIISCLSEDSILVSNKINYGIAKAQNQGIETAKQILADYVFLLDQDSIVGECCVSILYATIAGNNIALAAPAIIDTFNNNQVSPAIRIKGFGFERIPLKEDPIEIDYCIASGSLIPISVLDKVGMMREDFFIDNVDFEWCLRSKSNGYKIIQNPTARIYHQLGNGTHDKILSHSATREYYIIRNSIVMSKLKFIPLSYRFRKFIFANGRIIKSLLRGNLKYFRAGFNGLIHGLIGRLSSNL